MPQLSVVNRAAVQLGRTLEWGAYPDDFLKLSRLDLTRSTLGKTSNWRYLTFAEIMPKFFHRWIKTVDKDSGGRTPE